MGTSTRPPTALASGIAASVVTLCGFAAYAWSRDALYEATTHITLSAPVAEREANGRSAVERLEEATLDAALAARLARSFRPSDKLASARSHVRMSATAPARITITCSDSVRLHALTTCNEVARAAVERVPKALAGDDEPDRAGRWVEAVRQLTSFAAAHPNVFSPPPAAPTPEEASRWASLSRGLREARNAVVPPAGAGASVTATWAAPAIDAEVIGGGPRGVLFAGILSSLVVGLGVTLLQRPRRRKPSFSASFDRDEDSVSAAPRPISGAASASARVHSEPPPPTPRPPFPPATPLPPPTANVAAAPASDGAGQVVSTILPPKAQKSDRPPAQGSDRPPSPFVAVSYESSSLQAPTPSLGLTNPRTTKILGSPLRSPLPPTSGDGGATRDSSGLRIPAPTSRYSFVTTPPPAGGDPVRPHDLEPDWKPANGVDAAPCRPLCRELFAFGVEHCFTVGVTSVRGVEREKSEFACSLAVALAATGHARVLLIEADLDLPVLHDLMRAEMPVDATLSRQLQARMTRQGIGHWSVLRATKSLHLLIDGPAHTPGLILSRAFEDCVRAMRAYYDFVVLDGPPGWREAACAALDGVIDGLVVVCTEREQQEVPRVSRLFTAKRFSKAIRVRGETERDESAT
jgi:Mrp family chromosome partitioning ATPase